MAIFTGGSCRGSERSFGRILLLCVSCAAVMSVLTLAHRNQGSEDDKGEETIVGWMIERIAAGEVELSEEESIRQAIEEGEERFNITLTEENKAKVVDFILKLDTIEEEAGDYIEQAQELYRKYSTEFVEEANDTINGKLRNALKDAVHSFFQSFMR